MFLGRGSGGPKQSSWTKTGSPLFQSFFVRNSDSLPPGEQQPPAEQQAPAEADKAEGLRWLFTGVVGDESQPIHARAGCRVINVVSGVTGALICKGKGTVPGQGSCEEYWTLCGLEVASDTTGASRLIRGCVGDLRFLLSDGYTTVWCRAGS